MAKLLIGKVFYKDAFAGYLEERPVDRMAFTYDSHYIADGHPAISHRLPVREEPHISDYGLHPFFDNLVSEGWLEKLQSRAIRSRGDVSRFELLLAFGYDLAGAVSVIDVDKPDASDITLNMNDTVEMDELEKAITKSRGSLSGVQAKLAVVVENGVVRTPKRKELSTHIAKLSSEHLEGLIENEYLTMLAFKELLPNDEVAEVKIQKAEKIGNFLLVKRFDRTDGKRIHFEEFNQLLGKYSHDKYEGSYKDIADFMLQDKNMRTQSYLLYRRILAGILLGNTDMHFKNFAMFHTEAGLRLTPSYDQVAASLYDYNAIALAVAGSKNHLIHKLKAKQLCVLGEEFGLSPAAIEMAVQDLERNIESASDSIHQAEGCDDELKDTLIKLMRKRWNGTFSLIGKALLKKQ